MILVEGPTESSSHSGVEVPSVILPKVGSELAVTVVSPIWSTIIRDVARL
jgi:hypothetical protein